MKTYSFRTAALAAVLLAGAAACSVREDRLDCPCELTLRSVNVPTRLKTSGIKTDIIGEDGSSLFLDTISEEDFGQQDQFITKVPKGKVCVSGVTGAERYETRSGGTVLSVITGNQADSVFAHIGFVNCRGERAVDTTASASRTCLHVKVSSTVPLPSRRKASTRR